VLREAPAETEAAPIIEYVHHQCSNVYAYSSSPSIVAIHGIGAHLHDIWRRNADIRESPRWVDWLKEESMLPVVAPNGRTIQYGYKPQWLGKEAMQQNMPTVADYGKHKVDFHLKGVPTVGKFVQRDAAMLELEQLLVQKKATMSGRKPVVIHGLGGRGKSQLAIEYAQSHHDASSSVFWIDGAPKTSLMKRLLATMTETLPQKEPTADVGRQRYIPLSIRDQEIHAFPDNGSELDIVSRRFAKKHQLAVDRADIRTVILPNGLKRSTMGTATLQFRFKGEKESFRRTFHVLRNSIYDVVLGRSFLDATETLGTFMHRIKTKAVSWFSKLPRVHLLGSIAPRVTGSINGAFVNAIDDIGSDVNLISLKEARRLGLNIQTGEAYRTPLGFAEGSQASTYGKVVGVHWRFGMDASSEPIKTDFHVLQDLTCDLILSNDFLFDNKAYPSHIPLYPFEPTFHESIHEPAGFGMIMDLSNKKSLLEGLVAWFRSQPTNADPEKVDPEGKARREKNQEVARQLYHQERIENLPQAEQHGEWQAEKARRRKWADDFTLALAPVSASQGSSSIGSASSQLSSAAEVPPKGHFGIRRIRKALKSLDGG
jgi:hypothetical protein